MPALVPKMPQARALALASTTRRPADCLWLREARLTLRASGLDVKADLEERWVAEVRDAISSTLVWPLKEDGGVRGLHHPSSQYATPHYPAGYLAQDLAQETEKAVPKTTRAV